LNREILELIRDMSN